MRKLLDKLTKIENIIMITTFAIMVFASFAQVVNRNFFKLPITWFDEASVYCMIYMVLIGTEAGLRDGTQIAVTGLVDKLEERYRKAANVCAKIIVVLFSFGVLLGSIQLLEIQIKTGQVSAALGIPMSVPYAAMVISFAMITLVQGAEAIEIMLSMFKKKGDERK